MDSRPYKEAIKLFMKNQKKTYQELAEILEVSVPSIKRILNKDDLSFERLLRILDWLDMTISDLEVLAKDYNSAKGAYYTEEQELFFASDMRYWAYYLLLQDMMPKQIAEIYHLSDKSTEKYLRELEKLKLIKIQESGNIKINYPHVTARKNGELARAYGNTMFKGVSSYIGKKLENSIKNFDKEDYERSTHVTALNLAITEESFKKFQGKIDDLCKEIDHTTQFEGKFLEKKQLKDKVFLVAYTEHDNNLESLNFFDLIFNGGPSELF